MAHQGLRFVFILSFLSFVPAAKGICEDGLDVGIIVDRSKSIGNRNFPKLKKFLENLIDNFDVEPHKTRIGIILFADDAKVHLKFDESTNNSEVKKAIRNIPVKLFPRTYHYKALDKAYHVLFNKLYGERPNRKDVLLMFTDGRPSKGALPFQPGVKKLEDKGVSLLVVGITNAIKMDQLIQLAGHRGKALSVPSFYLLIRQIPEMISSVCPTDGEFSDWSEWSECSATCGRGGSTSRVRTCTKPLPSNGGKNCLGSLTEDKPCNTQPCKTSDPPEIYKKWSDWSACSTKCGGGIKLRTKSCVTPHACAGRRAAPIGARECNTKPCENVDGGYTSWSAWTTCSQTCGRGAVRTRTRLCTNPPRQKMGKNCYRLGPDVEVQQCKGKGIKKRCKGKNACVAGLDLHIIIDQSRSIPKSELSGVLTKFVPALLSRFKIHNKKTRVSISMYSSIRKTTLLNDFTKVQSYDKNKMTKMLQQTPAQTYYGTNLQKSLIIARKEVFTPKAGDRPDKHNVVVIFGDGKNFPYVYLPDYARPLKEEKKCHIVAVGFGNYRRVNDSQLNELAEDNVFLLEQNDMLRPDQATRRIRKLVKEVCGIDGGYGSWGAWSKCSDSCGNGVQIRSRLCDSPSYQKNGQDCTRLGPNYDSKPCFVGPCINPA